MPSEKVLEQKKQVVAELSESLKGACIGVIVDYKGITVAEDTKLRKQLRETGEYKVVKNTHRVEWYDEGLGCCVECNRGETGCECIIVFIGPAPCGRKQMIMNKK